MYSLLFLAMVVLAPNASAYVVVPRATKVAEYKNGVHIAPQITSPPDLQIRDVQAKSSLAPGQTCGYISGDPNSAVYCAHGLFCLPFPAIPAFSASFGIVTGALECFPEFPSSSHIVTSSWYPPTTCQEYNGDNTETYDIVQSQTLYCGTDNQKCATLYFPTLAVSEFAGIGPSSSLAAQPYTALLCSDTSTTETVYPTATKG